MPGFDRTGPRGVGPMTGGGRGFCSPWGRGRGYGFGRRTPYVRAGYWPAYQAPYPYGGVPYPGTMPYSAVPTGATQEMDPYAPQISREQELNFLQNQAQAIKGQLEQIEARMHELEKKEV